MKQQFLDIILKDSQQEVSCINLENMVDMLRDPDFRQKCQQCKQDYELIEIFPIVGFGITIKKIKINSQTQIKVTQFSKVEKSIDLNFLYYSHLKTKKEEPNCILPLLSAKEGNGQLLNCELFKRKISYLVHQKLDSYKEDTYLLLIQASIYHIIKKNGNQSWGKDILILSFETCQQVFINTSQFCNSIKTIEFQQSKFQLLNLICLFYMNQITTEEIFDYYIRPNLQENNKNYKLDEDQIKAFFNSLKFQSLDIIYQNIQQFMHNYLRENNYFVLKLSQNKFLNGLIEYMIPKNEQWTNLQKLEIIQNKQSDIREYKHYTISCIYQKLLNNLFEEYNEEKKFKYFESFSKHFEEDGQSYQQFLMLHKEYYEIYEMYELYNLTQNEFQSDNQVLVEQYKTIAIRFIVSKISIDQIKRKNPESILDLSASDEFSKTNQYLEIFKKIFKLNEQQAQVIHSSIIEEVKNLTWLNFLSSVTNFKEQDQIKLFLNRFLSHLKIWRSIQDYEACAKNLTDFSRFCFLLLQRTRMLKKIHIFSEQQLQDILIKNSQKEVFCKRIFDISRILEY
ncbi:unnamed protein product [Paramecium pentaurelia]|uniref:Uncharacterized protein n=1 Tax=Paramecium pentaurelia TaxID=43138 RepID=A0A8S1TAG3_9CILI|nr:unnamed protein product [Paramecium pentaurelia]